MTVHSVGRPPWYRSDGVNCESYVVGIAGGSASGKTSVSERIIKNLNIPWVAILSMDSFYKSLTPEQIKKAWANEHDFDHPSSFDYDILYETLVKLKQGKSVDVPIYDFSTHSRLDKTKTLYGANVVIFEGIFALYDQRIIDLMDLKIFVDTDADVRLARRLKRDISERGRDLHGVLRQYEKYVKPAFDEYIYPTMKYADIIIPRGLENAVAINLITKHIQRALHERNLTFRWDLVKTPCDKPVPDGAVVLEPTNQVRGMHTILRDRRTPRDEFIFYSERLSTLVVERALAQLPFSERKVITPTGALYRGKEFASKVCGVSILRAGGTMEAGLRRVIKDAPIGKILIQTDPSSGEPQLHFCKLPHDIAENYVLIMDATIGTGAAGLMAIRVILDHDVPEDRIIFLCLLAAPQGLHVIANAFPRVKICCSMVDEKVDENTLFIEPGIGNFGDRFFGTDD
ncbi:uncharacterized protein VTP21DRAFT_9894 [Calcarisporiella thermophila]|uniref:uncharacterized protein n=1 Tax=Calcarisporiella thermophila TaxID=911321 RepID=UPI003742784A